MRYACHDLSVTNIEWADWADWVQSVEWEDLFTLSGGTQHVRRQWEGGVSRPYRAH